MKRKNVKLNEEGKKKKLKRIEDDRFTQKIKIQQSENNNKKIKAYLCKNLKQ